MSMLKIMQMEMVGGSIADGGGAEPLSLAF
jgi:hypothetical protein